jgi:GntR family transcriptional regulator/MocR family aminotransferase
MEHGVVLRSLSQYYAGHRRRQGLLLGFSAFNVEEIGQGLSRLAQIKSAIIPMLSDRDVLKGGSD